MPPELRKDPENNINPADDLRSFSQQLAKMKKEVSKTVESMSKEIGTGLIDINLIKKQFKYLDTYINKNTQKFGEQALKGYRNRIKSFMTEQREMVRQLQKSRIFSSLENQQKEAIKIWQDVQSQVGTLQFSDALEEAKENLKDIVDLSQTMIDKGIKEGILKTTATKRARENLELMRGVIALKQQELQKVVAINDQLTAARDSIEDMVDGAFAFFDKIPGGKYFKTALGLDKIKEDIMKNVGGALSKSIDMGVSTIPAFQTAIKGIVGTYMQFAKMLLFNPWTIALIGIVLLIKMFVDLEAAGEDFRRSTGLTLALTKQLTPQIESAALSMRKYGVSVEDTYNAAAALYSTFQNIQVLSPKLIKTVALMEAKLGVSNENAAQVLETFLAMKGVNKNNLDYWIDTTSQLSHAAGIAPVDVFNDIAGSSELISTYMGASVEQIIKTAVNARKLGLEMEDVGSIIDSAMDWESSIEKELEASILLGRQINFNAARQKVFQGDIDGAAQEILRQVGSLESFNNMNYIQKKAIAEATGLTVSKLQESLSLQKKLNDLTPQQRIQYDAQQKDLEQINSTVTDLKNSFMAIGASLGKIVLPVIHAIQPVVKQIATVIGWISDAFNELGPATKEVTANIAGWSAGILLVSSKTGLLKKVFSMMGKGKPTMFSPNLGGKAAGAAGGIGSKINPTSMLKAAASLLIISGALWVFGKALQEIDKVKDITKALIAATIGLIVLSTVALALGSASPAMLLGALTIGVLAGALWLLGAAINQFVPMVDVLLKGISVIVTVVGDAITKVITAVADSFMKLAGLGSGLAMTAVAIYALTGAFAAFIAVSTAGSFATMFSGILGNSPIDQLERLAAIGPGLMLTASALRQFTGIPEISTSGIEGTVDVAANIGGIGNVITESNEKVNKKLDEVIAAVKNINVYLDGRKVNENIARNTSTSKLT